MTQKEFSDFRKTLGKTQKQMAQLMGLSLKAIHSYEQGWRSIPGHVERQVLFLLISRKRQKQQNPTACWETRGCPPEWKAQCPAWEFVAGDMCFIVNGMFCEGSAQRNWKEKMHVCSDCEVFLQLLNLEEDNAE